MLKTLAVLSGVVIGGLAYLGYRAYKQLSEIDIMWDELNDDFYHTSTHYQGPTGDDERIES